MKRIIQFMLLLCLVVVGYNLFNSEAEDQVPDETVLPEQKQGIISIVNTDVNTNVPIKNTTFTITDSTSNVVVETLKTDVTGKATSFSLNYGTSYKIRQKNVLMPYKLNDTETLIQVNSPSTEIVSTNQIYDHIKEFEQTDDGQVDIKKVYIDVKTLMQKPELPNGCEIVSLTAVLNYYGYMVSKTEMADNYLPKEPFTVKDNKLYGPDPNKAYSGNPRNLKKAFFSYAPPIVEAAEAYLNTVDGSNRVVDKSGSSREQIIEYLNKGIPVVIWTTLDLSKPKVTYGWYLNDTDEYFPAPVNLHVVVLIGYEDNIVHVMNPLKGQVTYNADTFFNSYVDMGSHALVVENS